MLRLRPIQRIEQWEVEASYWQSVGDIERSELLQERIEEIKTQSVRAPIPADSHG